MKLTKPAMENDISSLSNRMAIVEKKIESGQIAAAPVNIPENRQEEPKPKKSGKNRFPPIYRKL